MGLIALLGWAVFLGVSGFGLDFFWFFILVPIGSILLWLAWGAIAMIFAGLASLLANICERVHRWWIYVLLGPFAVIFYLISALFLALFVA